MSDRGSDRVGEATRALRGGDPLAVVDRAVVRMRLLAAAVLVFQSVFDRPAAGARQMPLLQQVAVAGAVLAVLSGLSLAARRRRGLRGGGVLAAVVHAADVLTAVGVVGLSSHEEVVWVLLVVPVLSAALRYRLSGAFLTWGVVALLRLGQLLWAADSSDLEFLSDLGVQTTRLAVVLLVALPAGYLSEHLMLEVRGLARVFTAAEQRSGLLEVVAEAGQRVNDLDSQVFDAALAAARGLGYTLADLWELDGGRWHPLAAGPADPRLAPPDDQLAAAERSRVPLVVDRRTGDPGEVAELRSAGLEAVVLTSVAGRRSPTVLRAALVEGRTLNPSQVECLELLGRQAGVALRNGELISDLQQAHEELEHQAFHDHLTGIANRALFSRRLEEATEAAAASGRTLALLFLDLDRFKAVNDGLGHAVGNDLLVAAVGRLRGCLRGDALLARMGGDEFAVLLPEVARRADAEEVAERACRALTAPFALGEHEVIVSTSVGIAYGDASCRDPGELLRRSDVAMYRSKARGRARWTVWATALEEATLSRLQLERDLRRAVDEDAVDVVFQPVLRADGTVAGVETLARWDHPEHGPVSPADFIAIAEDSDLIVDLGRCVTRRAVTVAHTWLAGADPECFVALNVSPRQLVHPGFAADLDAQLAAAGLSPRRLLLEITERIISSGPEAVQALHALSARGYRLALDDFGQGQTSLQHLRHFPLTALKIDRGFVSDADADPRVRVILEAIVALGRALELDVIAEGIETAEQAAALRALGCTYLQGYAVGLPVAAAQLPPPGSAAPVPVPVPVPVPTQRPAGALPAVPGG